MARSSSPVVALPTSLRSTLPRSLTTSRTRASYCCAPKSMWTMLSSSSSAVVAWPEPASYLSGNRLS
eukprot:CAMPEP_0185612312 /NCGR_PEP_ID=MMETSP0436-20130131/21015_1 /TAXON_ID=626734 ORGANISM="Favella taraikaensis, Strain Fe Narragansett Bay" /NCGR_SAMPLE_ID=MMETSP0436 /ASSEMBLY_ACC=CAM_ASM_000390 /LENGTH=66 /DNA_ID=CAMNT_0028245615 /DNA_START=29 /DNA_END=229 /DNA_ORIENTATION=+